MGKRRRRSSRDNFWTHEYGGMPVWGLALAAVAIIAFGAIAVPAAMSKPERTEARTVRPAPPMYVPEAKPVAAFIGDSYTSGAGGTGGGFAKLVAAKQGWELENLGRGGTGFITREGLDPALARQGCGEDYCESYIEMIDAAVAVDAAVVVVSGGRNNAADEPDLVRASIDDFFTTLRAELPAARIIVSSPLWDSREAPAALENIAAWEREAAEGVGAEYLDLGQPLEGRDELLSEDGVHPNNDGYEVIAEQINAALAP